MSGMIQANPDYESARITSVKPGKGDYVVALEWEDGSISEVDLTEPVFRLKHLRALRNKARFHGVDVGDWGWSIRWEDSLDFAAEKLRQMASEQKSSLMTPSGFRGWLHKHRLTQEKAAKVLGISKRSVANYSTGAQPITRTLALAMKGTEIELRTAIP